MGHFVWHNSQENKTGNDGQFYPTFIFHLVFAEIENNHLNLVVEGYGRLRK